MHFHPLRPTIASPVAVVVLSVLLSGCAASSSRELSFERATELVSQAGCDNVVILRGDPLSASTGGGFHCYGIGQGIAFRWYDEDDAALKMLADWTDLISDDNQLIYSDNWFSTGPPEVLQELFEGYRFVGPTTRTPSLIAPTTRESNEALCSSITYNILVDVISEPHQSLESQQEYFDEYEDLRGVVETIMNDASDLSHEANADLIDPFKRQAALTAYDHQIKAYCRKVS